MPESLPPQSATLVVVVATYNEIANLPALIPAIISAVPHARLIIADDNSPDGSPELLRELAKSEPRLIPLIRTERRGYGNATLDAFRMAMKMGATQIATLDADFSHDPASLPLLITALDNADVVLGSRYFQGVRVLNWHPSRLLLSLFANRYVKTILGFPVEDATSGFRAYRASAIEKLLAHPVQSTGYSFLVEVLYRLVAAGERVVEVPIIYTERREGQSKMSGSVIREAIFRPWQLRLSRKYRR